METKNKISFKKFLEIEKQLDIRIGFIADAERIPKSYGLKLTVEFLEGLEITSKTAFTNLGKTHEPEDLININCPFIVNLEPSVIKGVTSEVMIMVSDVDGGNIVVDPKDYSFNGKLI